MIGNIPIVHANNTTNIFFILFTLSDGSKGMKIGSIRSNFDLICPLVGVVFPYIRCRRENGGLFGPALQSFEREFLTSTLLQLVLKLSCTLVFEALVWFFLILTIVFFIFGYFNLGSRFAFYRFFRISRIKDHDSGIEFPPPYSHV